MPPLKVGTLLTKMPVRAVIKAFALLTMSPLKGSPPPALPTRMPSRAAEIVPLLVIPPSKVKTFETAMPLSLLDVIWPVLTMPPPAEVIPKVVNAVDPNRIGRRRNCAGVADRPCDGGAIANDLRADYGSCGDGDLTGQDVQGEGLGRAGDEHHRDEGAGGEKSGAPGIQMHCLEPVLRWQNPHARPQGERKRMFSQRKPRTRSPTAHPYKYGDD